jgi:2-amino-4-hydroxy-6-hydroxymethyldihydropteridine diphosphokinase
LIGKENGVNCVLLGFGANVDGAWGRPKVTFERALQALQDASFEHITCSPLYRTEAVANTSQPDYLNCVVQAHCSWAPGNLLRFIKGLERNAGRLYNQS